MTDAEHHLAIAATLLAQRVPFAVVVALAAAVQETPRLAWPITRQTIIAAIPTPDFRDATAAFLDVWQQTPNTGRDAIALALLTAAQSEQHHQQAESMELVWTGPEMAETRFRHTEPTILEVINSATRQLTIVSYAVYRIARIRDALVLAAQRGVSIRLLVETPNRIEGQGEYDCVLALGAAVASACTVYYWPPENRAQDPNGKLGILHVKCAVADSDRLFLSSANFTEYAFTINMELGLLLTGGKLPGQVEDQFQRLIDTGQVVKF